MPVARVEGEVMTDERLANVDAWCGEHDIACVYFLAGTNDPETTYAAERGRFFYTDARITLQQELIPGLGSARAQLIRPAEEKDSGDLESIARVSHQTTRFYHDPHLPDERCGELYAEWIRSSCNGGADAVLVADDEGRAEGYVTCELDEDDVGHIGLIAVAPERRGQGLGAALVDAALRFFADSGASATAVVTQSRNVAALRLFERAGYVIETTQLWFHKWYDR